MVQVLGIFFSYVLYGWFCSFVIYAFCFFLAQWRNLVNSAS